MSRARDHGAAKPLPTKGQGCTRRFDPDAMSEEHGADFSAAAELWRAMQEQQAQQKTDATRSEQMRPAGDAEK